MGAFTLCLVFDSKNPSADRVGFDEPKSIYMKQALNEFSINRPKRSGLCVHNFHQNLNAEQTNKRNKFCEEIESEFKTCCFAILLDISLYIFFCLHRIIALFIYVSNILILNWYTAER